MHVYLTIILLLSSPVALALRPLSGLILGDIANDKQYDPLDYVFQSIDFHNTKRHKKQVQEYIGFYREGVNLNNSCEAITPSIFYSTDWKKEKALQSVASTLRYIGLDLTIRAMAKYANELTWSKQDYLALMENLTNNYCSENITSISKRLLKLNMIDRFERPRFSLPSINNNTFYTPKIHGMNNSDYIKKRELSLVVQSFIAFCSWSGEIENYGLMYKYLKNPFVMSFINRTIEGRKIYWSKKKGTLSLKKSKHKVRVVCKDILCRKAEDKNFKTDFPKMVGSSGVESDLKRIYCNHYRHLSLDSNNLDPKLVKLDNDRGSEEHNFEIFNFISLVTTVPDFLVSSENYNDAQEFLKERIVDRWDEWAKRASASFSNDLLFEESLRIDLETKNEYSYDVRDGEFNIDFKLTLGEFDRSYDGFNMLDSKFNLELPKSFIGWIKRSYNLAKLKDDEVEMEKVKDKLHYLVDPQIKKARSRYLVAPFAKGIENIIVDELLKQIDLYNGDRFKFISQKMHKIPINVKYGLFALRYFTFGFRSKYR